MGTPSRGVAAQLAIDPTGTAIASYVTRFSFMSITPGGGVELIDTSEEEIRGTRSHSKERVVQGLINTSLTIVMIPTPAELDDLLPWILGTDESVDSFVLAETLQERDILIDWDVHRQIYTFAKVGKATFSSSKGQAMQLTLEIVAKTQDTVVATAFPSISIDTEAPYAHHQGVFTARGSSREFSEVSVEVDNGLFAEFNNSQNPTAFIENDRIVTVSVNTPFSADEDDLYVAALASSDGATGSLVYTNSGQSTTFTFGNLKEQDVNPPAISGKSEIRQAITFLAYKSGSTAELVITHDAAA